MKHSINTTIMQKLKTVTEKTMYYSHTCLVFALIGIATLTVAEPARQVRAANGPQDYHWRLVTGIKASRQHMIRVRSSIYYVPLTQVALVSMK